MTSESERRFALADLGLILREVRTGPGYTVACDQAPDGADMAGFRPRTETAVWWISCHGVAEAAQRALAASASPSGAVAFPARPGGAVPHEIGLALAFADHLTACRNGRPVGPCSPGLVPPPVPDKAVRLPHLVWAARPPHGHETATVVWELLPRLAAEQWLGAPLPDQAFFEERLTGLLHLKQRARFGLPPDVPAWRPLADLLAGGRYLSIRLVYQHPGLFHDLLTEAPA
ncbi:hypothetical protein ACGRHY_27700 [Streptomyces sp. HK10]|uniref:hypothetical protein n=1 Tax=Streptomyces sp. HK10 TaxID=3373255 RepID=UPI003748EFA4